MGNFGFISNSSIYKLLIGYFLLFVMYYAYASERS